VSAAAAPMAGKVCLISGGTSGIGKATATGLARLGGTVVLLSRESARGGAAAIEIAAATGNEAVSFMGADLASQASIREFVEAFTVEHTQLDVLVNCAHVYYTQRTETPDGLEAIFAVNYLAPFLLTNLLLGALTKGAPSRVVNITDDWGMVHRAPLDFDDLQATKDYKPVRQHNRAKLAFFYFNHELGRRLEGTGVTVNGLYPGHVDTGLKGDVPWFTHVAYPVFKRLHVMRTPEEGADTPIYLASSPQIEGVTGQHFMDRKVIEEGTIPYDREISRRLWDVSCELTHISHEVLR
jgi:retinol dehydrogenase-14